MNDHKPGWQTSEFWITLTSQVLALLVIAGVVGASERSTLEANLSSAITAIFTLATSGLLVWRYIHARTALKLQRQAISADPSEARAKFPALGGPFVPALLAVLVLGLGAMPAHAQLPWRRVIEQRQSDQAAQIAALIAAQQRQQAPPACPCPPHQQTAPPPVQLQPIYIQAPTPPPVQAPVPAPVQPAPIRPDLVERHYYFQQPYQQLPIAGQPLQQLPIQGAPLQQLPIQGAPLQQVPIQGQPLQPLPPSGQPRQLLPIAPGDAKPPATPAPGGPPAQPRQDLPIGPMPPATGGVSPPVGYQRYTFHTLSRPAK